MSYQSNPNIHTIHDYAPPQPVVYNRSVYDPTGRQGMKQPQTVYCPKCQQNRNTTVHRRLAALSWTLILSIILPILLIPAIIMICTRNPFFYYVHKCPVCRHTIARAQ